MHNSAHTRTHAQTTHARAIVGTRMHTHAHTRQFIRDPCDLAGTCKPSARTRLWGNYIWHVINVQGLQVDVCIRRGCFRNINNVNRDRGIIIIIMTNKD